MMDNTYFINSETPDELARILHQDQLVTAAIGGVFPELSPQEVASLQDVLDVACGPGGWVLEVADTHPEKHVMGIDISERMIAYAQAQARVLELEANTSFRVMDMLQPFPFAEETFDLINARFVSGIFSREAWSSFFEECKRVLRPGGIIRIVEHEGSTMADAPSTHQQMQFVVKVMWDVGKSFAPTQFANGPGIARVMKKYFHQVRVQPYAIDYSYGAPMHESLIEDFARSEALLKTFLLRGNLLSEPELDTLQQLAHIEQAEPNFAAFWNIIAIVGTKPI